MATDRTTHPYNRYLYSVCEKGSSVCREVTIFAKNTIEAEEQLAKYKFSKTYLMYKEYNVPVYVYNVREITVYIQQDLELVDYDKSCKIFSMDKLTKEQLKELVIESIFDTIEVDHHDYIEPIITDIDFIYDVD